MCLCVGVFACIRAHPCVWAFAYVCGCFHACVSGHMWWKCVFMSMSVIASLFCSRWRCVTLHCSTRPPSHTYCPVCQHTLRGETHKHTHTCMLTHTRTITQTHTHMHAHTHSHYHTNTHMHAHAHKLCVISMHGQTKK